MVMHHIMKKLGWSLQGQGHIEGSYNQSMTYWSRWCQTKGVGVLLPITRPSGNKMGMTMILTYSTQAHNSGYFTALDDKPLFFCFLFLFFCLRFGQQDEDFTESFCLLQVRARRWLYVSLDSRGKCLLLSVCSHFDWQKWLLKVPNMYVCNLKLTEGLVTDH